MRMKASWPIIWFTPVLLLKTEIKSKMSESHERKWTVKGESRQCQEVTVDGPKGNNSTVQITIQFDFKDYFRTAW